MPAIALLVKESLSWLIKVDSDDTSEHRISENFENGGNQHNN